MKKTTSTIIQLFILLSAYFSLQFLFPADLHIHCITVVLSSVLLVVTLVMKNKVNGKALWVLAIWLVFYFLCVVTVENIFQLGDYHYFSLSGISNVVFIVVFSLLASKLSTALVILERKLTDADTQTRVISFDQANGRIQAEFIRAKRYNYPLAIVVIKPNNLKASVDGFSFSKTRSLPKRKKQTLREMSEYLATNMRNSDLIVQNNESGNVLLVCPMRHSNMIADLVQRIKSTIEKDLGLQVDMRARAFPDDGTAFEPLYNSLL